ncbi:MAG: hypothetical protein BGN82_02650 [Alphaproteobacteria bacterium 65-7]|nr:MAG: hypothetical protein BGN82_02650 [Alphaproteobacteria bacterium 65-7]
MTLEESIVKSALKSLDWAVLNAHLDQIQMDAPAAERLGEIIRHDGDLIQKYPNPPRETKRTAFFHALSTYVSGRAGAGAAASLDAEFSLLAQVEEGYRGIIGQLDQSPLAAKPPALRVAAVLRRAALEYDHVHWQYEKATTGQKKLNLLSSPRLPDGKGGTFSPDAALTAIAETSAMALVMESYKSKWFRDGIVQLPALPDPDDQEIEAAGVTQMLAVIWRHWENTEKRRRFLGGELTELVPPNLPAAAPPHYTKVFSYQPPDGGWSELEVYDQIANIRMQDRHEQNFFDMEVETQFSAKAIGITHGARPAPLDWVSADEMHALVSLSQTLHYGVLKDTGEPAGLGLAEWVRGYAVLKEIARERTAAVASPKGYHLVLDRQDVLASLVRCGLSSEKAERFVTLASLHRSARDMFDCPLVPVGSAQLLVFAPALLHLNIVTTVLSNLANRGVQLSRKGKAFEIAMQDFFKKQGLKVAAFKAHRGGEEYEYDLVVAWDGRLFVFECKNRSLSLNDPVAAYYFEQEARSAAGQVNRLADALRQHPDLVEAQFGAECSGWPVIPCVLPSLPYSRSGEFEGAYFTDASALTRFFGEPYFRIKAPYKFGKVMVLHRTAVMKLWKGDKPSASDFIAHLDEPHQVMLAAKHLKIKGFGFELSPTEGATSCELYRLQYTTRSICEAVGADPDEVEQIIADHAKKFGDMQKELKAKGEL